MTSKQHQPSENSLENKAVRTKSKGHGQKTVGPASLSLLRFHFSIFWTRNTTRHLCSHASGHEVSREPLTWKFLGSTLLKPEKSRGWRMEHLQPLPSWCPQSKPCSHGLGDRHQGKCWKVMDGWRDQGADNRTTSRIHLVQNEGGEMPWSYFLVLTRRTVADGLPQASGKGRQGRPVTPG